MNFDKLGKPLTIFSVPRSGTHLTIDLIRRNFKEFNSKKLPFEPLHYLYLSIEGFFDPVNPLSEEKAFRICSRFTRPIIKIHTYSFNRLKKDFPNWYNWIMAGDLLYVVRDIKPVLVSNYVFYSSYSKKQMNFNDFFNLSQFGKGNLVQYWNTMNINWIKNKGITFIRYEDILKNPCLTLEKINNLTGAFLIKRSRILPSKMTNIWMQRLSRILINPESTAILGDKFSTKSPSWKKIINNEQLALIRITAKESLVMLNYIV